MRLETVLAFCRGTLVVTLWFNHLCFGQAQVSQSRSIGDLLLQRPIIVGRASPIDRDPKRLARPIAPAGQYVYSTSVNQFPQAPAGR